MLTQYPEAMRGRRMLLTSPLGCPAPTSRVLAAGPGRFGRQFPAAGTPAAAPGGPRRGRGPQRAQGAAGGARGRCCGSGAKPGRQGAAPPRTAPHAAGPRRAEPRRAEARRAQPSPAEPSPTEPSRAQPSPGVLSGPPLGTDFPGCALGTP